MQPPEKPGDSIARSERQWRFRLAAIVVAVVSLIVVAVRWSQPREPPLDRFKRQLRSELPVGASRADIATWAQHVVGRTPRVESWGVESLPNPPQRVLPEVAGVS